MHWSVLRDVDASVRFLETAKGFNLRVLHRSACYGMTIHSEALSSALHCEVAVRIKSCVAECIFLELTEHS